MNSLNVAILMCLIQDSDNDFSREIRVKKLTKYLDKFLQEYNK